MLAAIAGRARALVVPRPGQGRVAPFAGDRVGAGQQPAVDHDAAADAGAEDDAEDDPRARGGAVDRLATGRSNWRRWRGAPGGRARPRGRGRRAGR